LVGPIIPLWPMNAEFPENSQTGMLEPTQVGHSHALGGPESREHPLRILFVHRCVADVERCLYELKRVGFAVTSELVVTPDQFAERLRLTSFDLVLAEYPSSNWAGALVLDSLQQIKNEIPLIFLIHHVRRETVADLILKGASDCIEMGGISHLPVAIHRAQAEKSLRTERNQAEKDLGRSEARYQALTGNLNYGICRCGLEGDFLEVNEAIVTMLGYASREELLSVNFASDIVRDSAKYKELFRRSNGSGLVDAIEMDWTRKDRTTLKVYLSGREVVSERGDSRSYELIVEDVTKQRELESHLRRQAASDSLTGLANYKRLVDVLSMEIKRCERTGRQFALLLFDLDGLKRINDQYGHVTGSQALCRVADVLSFCCRDIDTAARFGGDEFALVLPETNAAAAAVVAKRICDSVANDGKGPKLSISVGSAIYRENGERIESLLSAADSAMYAMKQRTGSVTESDQFAMGLQVGPTAIRGAKAAGG
jgi:diguanylate cyclase (GGDEF)-like protein/PAS domain S-box-containing protein